jgi:AmmeMemoRadiSam system protein B
VSHPSIRPPAVAGSFYPREPARLAETVDGYLAAASGRLEPPGPAAVVVPHAGYEFSGPVAASAYARVDPSAVTRVVVLGPIHRPHGPGLVVPTTRGWRTPLGDVAIDDELWAAIASLPGVAIDDAEHAREHALEVQVPFLQRMLGKGWTLLPVGVRPTAPDLVADVLEAGADAGALLVVSSDLSHYHDHETATRIDRDTAAALTGPDAAAIGYERACGADALNGLRRWADRHGRRIVEVDLRTSGDTAGPRDRVVGYGAFTVACTA